MISDDGIQQNLIDTGIGLVIGSAFASMIQNLVDDLLTPLLGLVVGSRMANWFIVLRKGAKALQQSSKTTKFKYVTFEEALKDGAVILNVGKAAESVLRFICVAGAVFTLYRVAMKTWEANKRTLSPILFPGEKTASTRECGFCISEVPARATKCKYCTSGLHPLPEYAVSKDSKPQLTSAKDD
ncbi:hypothetical protein DFS34DRAFT_450629 [Phlyctochytrium arcticum]|nr:hypothetical protein DFS34DRAFT_450629 [Phlyctochytrium arcticum]